MLARAFATEPDVFLLDEPTADLDPAASHAIMRLLRRTADAGRTVVVVLHALDLGLRYAHRVVVLAGGRVTADLPAHEALPAAAAAFGLPFGPDPDAAAAAARLMRRFAVLSLGLHAALLVGLLAWFRQSRPEGTSGQARLRSNWSCWSNRARAPDRASEPTPAPADVRVGAT